MLGCESSAITVPVFYNVTVTVQDSTNAPHAGLEVYTLDGDTQVSDAITSDANGQVTFSLPAGDYRFRADLHGFQYFSNPTNNCTTPDCSNANISTPIFGKVTVTDRRSEYAPQANLPVYAYDDDTYTGVSGLTDSDGYVDLWLPAGDYRFRTDQFNLTYWSGSENNCTIQDCTFVVITILGTVNGMAGQTINYTYDPLYRLTAADYTDGRFFHYGYDSVGNRLSQNSKTDPITDPVTKTYSYDNANRLTGVNGASYTWDSNGNLINDGTSSYEYDPLNHLAKVISGNNTYDFKYDCQGNRVAQAVNGAWTYYDLDLNGGLTEVLNAQDEDYLYGLGLVAQNDPGDIEYLLTDGLGSVRQIVRGDSYGQVSLTRSYDPFGNLLSSVGDEASAFGYAGQWEDGYIKLIDLRSRMYSTDGRFLTEDTWQGDQNQPMSYNDWLYVYANPVNRTDPSGYSPVGPMSYPSGFNMTGPMAFAMCFAMGVSSPNVGWTGMTAGMAVATCKAAYDKVMWRIPITPGKGLPTDTSELFDWYINEYGDDHLYFDGNQPLTTELATSLSIQNIRGMFYQNGELSLKEFQFNLPDALGSLFVDSSRFGVFPLTLTQFLGSYWYQVKALDNCRVGFRLDNDTTLSSGSHLLGRFKEGGYYGSVEDLIGRKPGIADEPLEQVLRENTTLISILTDRKRNETGGNGGGTMYQTFTWTEKRGEWRNFLPWEALRNMLDIQDWNDYAAHTKSVFH